MKALAAILIVVLVWAAGFLAFVGRVAQSTPPDDPAPAQAIVALTGKASARIQAAAQLLEQGKGTKLLISGVNRQASRADILALSRSAQPLYDCCVQLGFEAADTKGNAREIAAWARHEGFTSLIVVTADYHMPRAMLEIHGALPDAALTPYPVATDEVDARRWWASSGGARRMAVEYCKYLAVLARESFLKLGPRPDAASASGKLPKVQ